MDEPREIEYLEEPFDPADFAPPGDLTADDEPGDCAGEDPTDG